MWWLNAKYAVGVTAVIFNERGEVLFLEHAFRSRYPWALPGGWMERREQPLEAVAREVREETGLEIQVEDVLTARTFTRPRMDVVYRCRVTGGVLGPSFETPRWRWCRPGDYPPGTDPFSIELVALAEATRA